MGLQYDLRLHERKDEWLVRAVLVGFIATGLMTSVLAVAYVIAVVLGSSSPEAPILLRWMWALANNAVTRQAQTAVAIAVLLHFVAGIAWAVVYASFVEPRLSGPGWRRGLLFAPLPGILSLVVLLPALGGGLFGLGLGAGPLPIVGNLVLHLVYGASLGYLYPPENDRLLLERGEIARPEEVRSVILVERSTATGMILGLILGGLGGLLGSTIISPDQPALAGLVLGVLLGSAAGALIGSYSRLDTTPDK